MTPSSFVFPCLLSDTVAAISRTVPTRPDLTTRHSARMRANASGWATWGKCPLFGIATIVASGKCSAIHLRVAVSGSSPSTSV